VDALEADGHRMVGFFGERPLPVHVLYSHTRQLSPRLRVVIDWMAEQFRSMVTP
jgi:DNA-binding transcriptional LysR family regulator